MEPPAKRMRILQSIGAEEVDESNPEYIQGKKQNSEWLKNKWDAIYEKYGAMSDMMSDEVDMRGNGAITVDRGHMRKLDKEYRKRLGRRTAASPDDTQLADDMFANDPEMEGGEDEDSDVHVRDELAPSMSPEPMTQYEEALPVQVDKQTEFVAPGTPATTILQTALSASTYPAADLLQLVQFPQTPAGQQARKAFEAQTAQAVQQAVASIFSSLLSTVPTLQPQPLGLLQAPATPTVNFSDGTRTTTTATVPATVPTTEPISEPNPVPATESAIKPATVHTTEPATVPATEPILHHAHSQPYSSLHTATQSSPIVTAQNKRRKRRSFATGVCITPRQHSRTPENVPLFLESDMPNANPTMDQEVVATPVHGYELNTLEPIVYVTTKRCQKPMGVRSKHVFTEEENQYLVESRIIHKRTWKDIANSREHWKSWKLNTIQKHWSLKLKARAADMKKRIGDTRSAINEMAQEQDAKMSKSPTASYHLPTPSSLGRDEDDYNEKEPISKHIKDILVSGGHLDDDEKDLLSIHEDDGMMCDVQDTPLVFYAEELQTDSVQEIPETPQLTQEDSIQQVLQGNFTRESTMEFIASSVEDVSIQTGSSTRGKPSTYPITNVAEIRTQTVPSSSLDSAPKPITKPTTSYPARPEDVHEHDIDLVANKPYSDYLHQCPLCRQVFTTAAILHAHEKEPHPSEVIYRASSPLPPTTQHDPLASQVDSFIAPATPLIKREPVDEDDPRPSTPAFKTPTSAAQIQGLGSSGANGSAKLSRSAYNKVKASWARKATPASKKKRMAPSRQVLPKKRFWDEYDEGSEDELAR